MFSLITVCRPDSALNYMKKQKFIIHKHGTYIVPAVSTGAAKRPQKAKPRQSMSLDDVVRKYLRGLPVDAKVHPEVYMPHNRAADFERMSKLDFDDKAALAAEKRAEGKRYRDDLKAAQQAIEQQDAQEKREREQREQNERSESGSDVLDNTLPDDTRASERGVSRNVSKSKRN